MDYTRTIRSLRQRHFPNITWKWSKLNSMQKSYKLFPYCVHRKPYLALWIWWLCFYENNKFLMICNIFLSLHVLSELHQQGETITEEVGCDFDHHHWCHWDQRISPTKGTVSFWSWSFYSIGCRKVVFSRAQGLEQPFRRLNAANLVCPGPCDCVQVTHMIWPRTARYRPDAEQPIIVFVFSCACLPLQQ